MRRIRVALSLLAGLFALGAGDRGPALLVFGAASLTEALQDLGKTWEARTGQRVTFSFGASSDLARQIQAGAPADVFFSADTTRMDALERAGLVGRDDRREFLSNVLVVVVPSGSKLEIRSPADLARLPRLALADPAAVPAGIYARKWLEGLGLWDKIQPRVVPTLDVRAALSAVETEAVPAAIVYRSDAIAAKGARVAFTARGGPEIVYAAAPLLVSGNRKEAGAFVRFLDSELGRAEFRKRGFLIRATK